MICFSTVQISLSSSGELALSASSPSLSRQTKRASGGTVLGSYPNTLCFTYSVVLSPHFWALDWISSFSFAVTRTAMRRSFSLHISPFEGLGAAPPKSQPIPAVIGTSVAHKVPACYTIGRTSLYHRTHLAGHKEKRLSNIKNCVSTPWGYIFVIEPIWLKYDRKFSDLSHISAFWLSRTFQGHPAHSFRFRLVVLRSTPVVPAQRQEVPQQTTPPAIPPV